MIIIIFQVYILFINWITWLDLVFHCFFFSSLRKYATHINSSDLFEKCIEKYSIWLVWFLKCMTQFLACGTKAQQIQFNGFFVR